MTIENDSSAVGTDPAPESAVPAETTSAKPQPSEQSEPTPDTSAEASEATPSSGADVDDAPLTDAPSEDGPETVDHDVPEDEATGEGDPDRSEQRPNRRNHRGRRGGRGRGRGRGRGGDRENGQNTQNSEKNQDGEAKADAGKNGGNDRKDAPAKTTPNKKKTVERMIVNARDPMETRIAIANDDALVNLFWEKNHDGLHRGDIVLGKIKHIEKGLQAAFIDLGNEQTGFLHEKNVVLNSQVNKAFRKGRIEGDIPKLDQFVVVQLLKEKYSQKCPTVTMQVSIPGRNIVMMPVAQEEKIGISRKISDQDDRKRLKDIMRSLDLPKDTSFIVRTAGDGANAEDLQRDVNYLHRLQELLGDRIRKQRKPGIIYAESDFVIRVIRDVCSDDTKEIVIDNHDLYKRVRDFMKNVMPEGLKRIKHYKLDQPIFTHYDLEQQIGHVLEREVPLPSGGSIVIEPTEAMVSIDVNSGKSHHGSNTEETALHTNLEAVNVIARQLRMRDLGGIICIDFIDMQAGSNRRQVYRAMMEQLKNDKARTRGLELSKFCIMEITRQRLGQSLTRYLNDPCPACGGSGLVRAQASLHAQILRELRHECYKQRKAGRLELKMLNSTALGFSNAKRAEISELETKFHHSIEISPDIGKKLDEYDINFYSV